MKAGKFKNLLIKAIKEDNDLPKNVSLSKYMTKHWKVKVENMDTLDSATFDYYGGSAVEFDALSCLQCLLSDAEVVVQGDKGSYYRDNVDYLISEFGCQYKDAVDIARGCEKNYNKLSEIIDNLDDVVFDYLNELSEMGY